MIGGGGILVGCSVCTTTVEEEVEERSVDGAGAEGETCSSGPDEGKTSFGILLSKGTMEIKGEGTIEGTVTGDDGAVVGNAETVLEEEGTVSGPAVGLAYA